MLKWFGTFILAAIAVTVLAILIGRWLFPLPDLSSRPAQAALPADPATRLGQRVADDLARHPGQSGVIPLAGGHDALGSRLSLVATADRSIDAQYYIWHDDTSGRLLLKALYDAAARGVRVRLLLDDNGVPRLDQVMAALNAQPNFQIRLFNPSTVRKPKLAGYALDFMRMNRRMHNKSFIVDGQAAIIGGRNIGDEYFRVGDANYYLDMDVLAVGEVVGQTADIFDAYWNSASVFAVDQIIPGPGDLDGFLAAVAQTQASQTAKTLQEQLDSSASRFHDGAISPEFTRVQVIADDPVKGLGRATPDQLMVTQLNAIMAGVNHSVDVISAYFVPGTRGTQMFGDLARAGKRVRILTNAMNTTDVLVVHAGYTKYRRDLLKAGVSLYELKLRAAQPPGRDELHRLGLSGAALHAKTFSVDDRRVFIGSFNFDPRSVLLNCEMGFIIDSPSMARSVSEGFDGPLNRAAYQPVLTLDGQMAWTEELPDGKLGLYQQEPGARWYKQFAIVLIGLLPVEWLL